QIGLQEFPGRVNGTVRTVAVINSVKGGHISGSLRLREDKTHREIAFEETYAAFLNRGLRVSPTADQDTHTPNWGTVTACRTAVWSPTVTAPDLQGAFQANRVYVTEDDEMVVAFQVRYGGKRYWMGETVPLADDEEVVTVRVKIWQAPGNEGDPVEEGPYRVRLRVDTDGVGGDVAQFEDTTIDVETEQVAEFTRTVSPGQYFYLWIRELNGQDNPSGDARSDSPGDLNDSAMTSPVWFALADPVAPPVFIWSVNSQKYHDPHCWAVANILPENRREGPDPGGRTRHDCPAGP
ncbi:MAG TPA: hypothetical protein VEI97_18935, partial [bacterium]|nr:hypothetical protein [bacterium]